MTPRTLLALLLAGLAWSPRAVAQEPSPPLPQPSTPSATGPEGAAPPTDEATNRPDASDSPDGGPGMATESSGSSPTAPTSTTPPAGPPRRPGFCEEGGGLGLERGLFRIGQPDQVVPPPSGWTVMVPPFPPVPPRPGEKPPATPPQPWKPLFFDNDFRYIEKPGNNFHNGADFLKRRALLDDRIKFDFGGEFRWQARAEDNRRLTGEQNNFNLFRERLYLDTWYQDRFRVYWEVYWADSSGQTVPPVFFDVDHGDVNNAFGEYRMFRNEEDNGWLSIRYGWHEELLFGNQRLVSPLDWANARRTFDLIPHLLYRGNTWNYDLFWSRPNVILPRALNQPNYQQQFFGSYLTYKGLPKQLYDVYYLGLLSSSRDTAGFNGETGANQVHTLGARWQGEWEDWLWEGEAAYQFGLHRDVARRIDAPRNAGMVSAGFGRRFVDAPTKPEFWFYYDYASGSQGPNSGDYATFNQLFPLGHKYFGYMDFVGRQNILHPNAFMKMYFGKRANLLFWYHNFQLASSRDALYNAAGAPIRRDPTGKAGRSVGDELDITLNLIINPNSDLQFGYCYFWAGSFIQRTAKNAAQAQDGNFFYSQFTVRF